MEENIDVGVIDDENDDIKPSLYKDEKKSPYFEVNPELNTDANRSKALIIPPHKLHLPIWETRDDFLSNFKIGTIKTIVPSCTHLDRGRLSGHSNWIMYPPYMLF